MFASLSHLPVSSQLSHVSCLELTVSVRSDLVIFKKLKHQPCKFKKHVALFTLLFSNIFGIIRYILLYNSKYAVRMADDIEVSFHVMKKEKFYFLSF